MRSTATDPSRRGVLAGLAGLAAAAPWRPALAGAPGLVLGARMDGADGFRATGFAADGSVRFDRTLPARGHGFAARPGAAQAATVARRPGDFIAVFDTADGRPVAQVAAAAGRHFNGHAAYAPDGGLLYATETEIESGCGRLGVYDAAAGYRRLGELPSHGLDPHEVLLLADGTTLAVANGGLLTHPDAPGMKLNVDSMQPNLAWIDRRDGRLLASWAPPAALHRLGTRHIARLGGGAIAVATQYEGVREERAPLLALATPDGRPARLLAPPAGMAAALENYAGSVAVDAAGELLAVACPRGNRLLLWEIAGGRLCASAALGDVCGLAPGPVPGSFLAAGGLGGIALVDGRSGAATPLDHPLLARSRWDNHLLAVG